MEEIWKPVRGYEGKYEVSNRGEIRSLNYMRTGSVRQIKAFTTKSRPYLCVVLVHNGKLRTHLVHRLVAEAFIPNPENKPCIDHINTVKTDNSINNLRWVTHKENYHNPKTEELYRRVAHTRNLGKHLSETHKEKLRILNTGENNAFYGKKHTAESRAKISEARKRMGVKVLQFTKDWAVVKEWSSIKIAAKSVGVTPSCITSCCRGRKASAGGFKWKYKDSLQDIAK